jgi:hypothetical protein
MPGECGDVLSGQPKKVIENFTNFQFPIYHYSHMQKEPTYYPTPLALRNLTWG